MKIKPEKIEKKNLLPEYRGGVSREPEKEKPLQRRKSGNGKAKLSNERN